MGRKTCNRDIQREHLIKPSFPENCRNQDSSKCWTALFNNSMVIWFEIEHRILANPYGYNMTCKCTSKQETFMLGIIFSQGTWFTKFPIQIHIHDTSCPNPEFITFDWHQTNKIAVMTTTKIVNQQQANTRANSNNVNMF